MKVEVNAGTQAGPGMFRLQPTGAKRALQEMIQQPVHYSPLSLSLCLPRPWSLPNSSSLHHCAMVQLARSYAGPTSPDSRRCEAEQGSS
jgi:hypothetical protein